MEPVKRGQGLFTEIIDKVCFANYFPLLLRATAESDEQTPGYMLQEIERITFQSSPHSQQLTDYLTKRLDKSSATVKLKVLKIMLHLIHNGHVSFRQNLRRNDESLKMATLYHGPPDPLLGTSSYEAVRKNAQGILQQLFDPELIQLDEDGKENLRETDTKTKLQLGGLGSAGSTNGKYEGFGSSPIDKEERITDKMLDIFTKLITPVDETAEIINSAVTSSPGNYEAVLVDPEILKQPQQPVLKKEFEKLKSSSLTHVPGRAGGGWESDEEDTGMTAKLQYCPSPNSGSHVSTDSLERFDPALIEDDIPEKRILIEFCSVPEFPCSLKLMNDTCRRCESLNCIDSLKVILSLLHVSSGSSNTTMIRALLILEWFLRVDFVAVDVISNMFSSQLKHIIEAEQNIGPELKVKAEKLLLILQKLKTVTVQL